MFTALPAGVAAAALVLGAATAPTAPPAPSAQEAIPIVSDSAVYRLPTPTPAAVPGRVIQRTKAVPLPGGGSEQKILYWSSKDNGRPTAVSAKLFVPAHPAPHAPVLSLAHGTIGLADCAAPSRDPDAHEAELAYFSGLAQEGLPTGQFAHGAIVVATDYEGLGTPGPHPYLVGRSEGADLLDAVRAARELTATSGPSLVIGHSQGGGAALWAAQMAPTYAPDVDLVGAVAGSPAVELARLVPAIESGDYVGYLFMLGAGLAAGHPRLPLASYLTPAGLTLTRAMTQSCDESLFTRAVGQPLSRYVRRPALGPGPFRRLLQRNTPGNVSTPVPIFVYHGAADEQLPVESSEWYLERTARTGGYSVERRTYAGEDHHSVIAAARPDVTRFISERLAGAAPHRTAPAPAR